MSEVIQCFSWVSFFEGSNEIKVKITGNLSQSGASQGRINERDKKMEIESKCFQIQNKDIFPLQRL